MKPKYTRQIIRCHKEKRYKFYIAGNINSFIVNLG